MERGYNHDASRLKGEKKGGEGETWNPVDDHLDKDGFTLAKHPRDPSSKMGVMTLPDSAVDRGDAELAKISLLLITRGASGIWKETEEDVASFGTDMSLIRFLAETPARRVGLLGDPPSGVDVDVEPGFPHLTG